jgi:hypothetical protein
MQADPAISELFFPEFVEEINAGDRVDVELARKLAARWIIKENPTIRKNIQTQCIRFNSFNQLK